MKIDVFKAASSSYLNQNVKILTIRKLSQDKLMVNQY